MTEEQAREVLTRLGVSRETFEKLDRFIALLRAEASRQNLIAASTLDHIYSRHILDSAQLAALARPGRWLDLGSGAGFPGMVVAMVANRPVTLVESRRRRCEFLRDVAASLEIEPLIDVRQTRVETLRAPAFDVISARAFAPLPRLLEVASHLAHRDTMWLLPKGRSAADELARAEDTWQSDFALVPSATDAESAIIVARRVRPRTVA